MNYLKEFAKVVDSDVILALRAKAKLATEDPRFLRYKKALALAPEVHTKHLKLGDAVIEIGAAHELNDTERSALHDALSGFMPWKKGPFNIFGIDIDAEWRSDIKWDRLKSRVGNCKGKVVADIGCHNGYFMFRMAESKPDLVLGFEPYAKLYYNFQLLQKYANIESLVFEPFGLEHLNLYPNFFDRIFCMGILYHHRDPVGLLEMMRRALKRNGDIVIDCQGIDSQEPIALVPENRYATAKGIWFLPSLPCLLHWVKRAGFQKVDVLYSGRLESTEQRKTPWANNPSLADFLDPDNPDLTIEGYPAPHRVYLVAK